MSDDNHVTDDSRVERKWRKKLPSHPGHAERVGDLIKNHGKKPLGEVALNPKPSARHALATKYGTLVRV